MDLATISITDLSSLALEVCAFLNRNQFDFALTGWLALSVWGYPRSTMDVDLVLTVVPQTLTSGQSTADSKAPFIMEPDDLIFPHMKVYRGLMRREPHSAECVMIDMLIVNPSWSAEIMKRRVAIQLLE